jgi:SAM-dependent methyltransferase
MSEKHFNEQKRHAEAYLIPFLWKHCPGFAAFDVLEAGCAEAGLLDALERRGIRCAGVELEPNRAALARVMNPRLDVRVGDITDPELPGRFGRRFDLVVMRDVIEHVPGRDALFQNARALVKPGGFLYVTFPPRFSPFAGHHQNGRSALRYIPWAHLAPPTVLRLAGRALGEWPHIAPTASALFRSGLSVRGFETLALRHGFRFEIEELFLIRPVYRTRLGMKPVRMANLPWIREAFSLGCESLLRGPD